MISQRIRLLDTSTETTLVTDVVKYIAHKHCSWSYHQTMASESDSRFDDDNEMHLQFIDRLDTEIP